MKSQQLQTVELIREILQEETDEPAAELIKIGTALIRIGEALRGLPLSEARKIIKAVDILQ